MELVACGNPELFFSARLGSGGWHWSNSYELEPADGGFKWWLTYWKYVKTTTFQFALWNWDPLRASEWCTFYHLHWVIIEMVTGWRRGDGSGHGSWMFMTCWGGDKWYEQKQAPGRDFLGDSAVAKRMGFWLAPSWPSHHPISSRGRFFHPRVSPGFCLRWWFLFSREIHHDWGNTRINPLSRLVYCWVFINHGERGK